MRNWKQWFVAAGIRAAKTFAQTLVSLVTVGSAFSEIQWIQAASVSGVAAVLSLLTSVAGLPEVPSPTPAPTDENEE